MLINSNIALIVAICSGQTTLKTCIPYPRLIETRSSVFGLVYGCVRESEKKKQRLSITDLVQANVYQ